MLVDIDGQVYRWSLLYGHVLIYPLIAAQHYDSHADSIFPPIVQWPRQERKDLQPKLVSYPTFTASILVQRHTQSRPAASMPSHLCRALIPVGVPRDPRLASGSGRSSLFSTVDRWQEQPTAMVTDVRGSDANQEICRTVVGPWEDCALFDYDLGCCKATPGCGSQRSGKLESRPCARLRSL
jgi:hypothetical protein